MFVEADMKPLELATYNRAMLTPEEPRPAANGFAHKGTPQTYEEIDAEDGTLTLRLLK